MRVLVSSAACAALLCAAPPHAWPQDDDPDVVALTSGSRLLGTIVGLSRGELTFSIAGAGRVDIDWRNVVSMTSSRLFDVELQSGERLSGSLDSPSPGQLAVTAGTAPAVIDAREVVRITSIGATPAERTSGYVDLGFDLRSANDELDFTVNASVTNQMRNFLTKLSVDSVVSEIDDATAQRRNYLQVSSRRLLSDRWFAIGRLHLEEDFELDLDSRTLLGFGAGRTLVQSDRTALALYGGLAADRERFRGISGTDRTAEAFLTVEWDWFELGETEISTEATTYFSFDRSRRRFELDATLHRYIAGSLYWSVSLYESYDSDPPPGLENSDLGLSLTLGRSF